MQRYFVLCFCALTGATVMAQQPGEWPVERLQSEVPGHRLLRDGPIQSLVYEGEIIDGKRTEVFAFYGSPITAGIKPDGKVPGVVLIHGGGGTAFADWVWLWVERGYAAIAMDLSGRRPPFPEFDDQGKLIPAVAHNRKLRVKLERGGLDHTHAEKFDSIGGTVEDDWPYHAVANVMRAHSLLRSFAEVDPEKTAVTGISWGGYTTCLAASIDDRFKAAVPVYGCGFLHEGESVQKPSIDRLGDRKQAWVKAYDPGSHLGKCRVPTLWVNGTHDKHYVLDSYAKSYGQVQGPRSIRIQHRMRHGHQPGWAPEEIGIFIDSYLKDGVPLPKVGDLKHDGGVVSAKIDSQTTIEKVELFYTVDQGPRTERKWQSVVGSMESGEARVSGLPDAANTWLLAVTDDRGAMVSSQVGFR